MTSLRIKALQTLSQELSPTGGKLVAMKCDVSKEEDILSMMSAIKSQYGGQTFVSIMLDWVN